MKNFSIAFILSLFLFGSCSDLLDVSPTSVITTASFWETEGDAEGALIGMYVNLRSISNSTLYYLGEARADVVGLGTVGDGGWSKYYLNRLHQDDAGPTWQSLFTLVNSANLIIKYVPEIEFASEDRKNNILAEAYAMRAYTYFVMTKTWGDLPLRQEPTESENPEITQIERTAQSEIFQFIKGDIDQALQLFPDNSYAENKMFWSKPATNALKGEVYLWTAKQMGGGTADLQTALTALEAIQTTNVSLLDNFEDVFDYSNKGNDEIIMAVRFAELESAGNNYFNAMYLIGSAIPTNISTEARETIGAIGGGSNNIVVPTDYVKSLYSDADQRKDASFYEIFTINEDESLSYYTTIVTKGSGTVIGGSRNFIDDIILFRYADVLLMIAEAKNALGEDPSMEINEVRMRAYGENYNEFAFTSGTMEENDAIILEERLREMAFEGKRWWDLVRFDKAIEMLPTLSEKENAEQKILWPIATSVLSLENKVLQNPGYE
ncbi:RagB/SusD family nutrient uptake outer membrane protein [Cyclobacterium marinum]|uniref:RagB/SusD domain-containing protein n=1 Tax=Cyclobacterium marinum (strain ATCC 25205 / DSM 745 / LMG 13164 / NCIMB 1802) TaxID=880070 RepID=G0J1V2_CYCMS|nr:RagB/SusD family nutrient uptake outer membrane protein [Cyclobacterium marinum]AEL23958.1 RagB/SusD domain-containing protein [Cyclobacterium marinum DSM 745]MBR9776862.1 RagB/SusD family nutrient uptake outer membrane protein [Cytophagales bacterium]|tara:strand:+ start:58655 stop:60136 length:1482 start_codon:yes stop_codon:yes gene_type:complete